jgi:hypothetical protein
MKYINRFSTNADYQTFTEGGGYVTPNVCYVEETDGIVMKPYVEPKEDEYNYNLNIVFDEIINGDYTQLYNDLCTICIKYHDIEREFETDAYYIQECPINVNIVVNSIKFHEFKYWAESSYVEAWDINHNYKLSVENNRIFIMKYI